MLTYSVVGRCLSGKAACLMINGTCFTLRCPCTVVQKSKLGMKLFPSRQCNHPMPSYSSLQWKKGSTIAHFPPRIVMSDRLHSRAKISRLMTYSKGSSIQDFQDFVSPKQLLPANEADVYSAFSMDELCASLELDCSCAYYIVQLQTSSEFDSGLSETNSAILLCLIDVNGNSILQRISAFPTSEQEKDFPDFTPFQRNSSDWIVFKGSALDDIEAVWISTEKGCWRIGGMNLIVIQPLQPTLTSMDDSNFTDCFGVNYSFNVPDTLLGECSDMSMAEVRPVKRTAIAGTELLTLLKNCSCSSPSFQTQVVSLKESMREYSDLKFSLLLYDSLLVVAGTWLLTFTTSEISGAYFIGGVCGFVYLLLLQRSVDGLSMSELDTKNDRVSNPIRLLGEFKGPLTNLAVVFIFTVVVLKFGVRDFVLVLKPEDLLSGVAGFLACKIAALLAAFKPLPLDKEEI